MKWYTQKEMTILKTERYFLITLCIAFILGWLISFGHTVFLNNKAVMYQPQAIPSLETIGYDLKMTIQASKEWIENRTPYHLQIYSYPPFSAVLFSPFVLINFTTAYLLFFFLSITSLILGFIVVDKIFPNKISSSTILIFFLTTSFFSYGLHFELERGQFNVIAMALSITAIYLYQQKYKLPALLLLTIATQLKIYPAIFFLIFIITDIKNRKSLISILLTGILNILLLFILGIQIFKDFIYALLFQMKNPYFWEGNHSLLSYCSGITKSSICSNDFYPFLIGTFALILLSTIFIGWKKKLNTFNVYLFTLCGIILLTIPSASHDYTLSLLPLFIFPLVKEYYSKIITEKKPIYLLFLFVVIISYSLSLFSLYTTSTLSKFNENKAPILLAIAFTTYLSFLYCIYKDKFSKQKKKNSIPT